MENNDNKNNSDLMTSNILQKAFVKIRGNSCLFFTLLFIAACSHNEVHIPPEQFAEKMKDPGAIVLDVRTPEEFSSGHLDAAVNMNWNGEHFMEEVKSLDHSKPVLLYCRTANRSTKAASALRKAGFNNVYVLEGGITKWRAEGHTVSE